MNIQINFIDFLFQATAARAARGLENKEGTSSKYDDIMNVKLLLKEICLFLDMTNCENSPMAAQIRVLV